MNSDTRGAKFQEYQRQDTEGRQEMRDVITSADKTDASHNSKPDESSIQPTLQQQIERNTS